MTSQQSGVAVPSAESAAVAAERVSPQRSSTADHIRRGGSELATQEALSVSRNSQNDGIAKRFCSRHEARNGSFQGGGPLVPEPSWRCGNDHPGRS